MITTSVYRLPANLFANTVMKRWLSRNWWLPVLPTLLFVILGISVNLSFYYVALMVPLLIFPTVLLMVYLNYAMSEAGMKHVHPCEASLSQAGDIILKYYPITDEDNQASPCNEEILERHAIESVTANDKYIIIYKKKEYFFPRFIPLNAFETPIEAEKVLKTLEEGRI